MRLFSCFRALSILTALLLTSTVSQAQESEVAQLIARGDLADAAFQPGKALEDYLPAEKLDPTNVQLLLRIARQYRHLMTDAKTKAMKLKLGQKALDFSHRAAALAPNDSEAQLSPAITYGKMRPFFTTKEQVAASPRIKEGSDKAIKLDPRNDTAWHVLGRWHQAVAGVGALKRAMGQLVYGTLPVSTNEESVKCFEKAIELNPNRLRHYIELGCTYAQMGRAAEAQRFIKKGLAMPDAEHDDPEIKLHGRETLATLQ